MALAIAVPARAHLLVTEVGYDPVDEAGATAEFVEIMNPGPAAVPLSGMWLANDEEAYALLVNGPIVSGITSGDFVCRFPDLVLEPGRIVVVCHDSDAFLAEHFAGGPPSFFTDQPGQPILLEITDDGIGDGVPAMTTWGSNPAGTMSMANNGECIGLAEWDGAGDRVRDHDWVCWLTLNNIPNKDVDFPFGIDGPDADLEGSFFLEDLGTAVAAPDAPEGMSIHRASLAEPGEATGGGNGIGGHDETTEDWSAWQVGAPTPGRTAIGVVAVEPTAASDPGLRFGGAAPNPLTSNTRIEFVTPASSRVTLTLHDLQGRSVAVLVDDVLNAGPHVALWDAAPSGLARGVYFARLAAGGAHRTLRLVRL
jgi:hypothetical protein